MIRLEKNKLIIEINCNGLSPLRTLAEYQKSLITMLHIANLKDGHHNNDEVINGIHFFTNLLKEMTVCEDQNDVLFDVLTEKKMDEFNKWCR